MTWHSRSVCSRRPGSRRFLCRRSTRCLHRCRCCACALRNRTAPSMRPRNGSTNLRLAYDSPMKKTTRVNHPPAVDLPTDNHSVVAPIYQSVKFEFDSLDETERFLRCERPGFFYTRASNPTTRQLELTLAELQGREDCLVT